MNTTFNNGSQEDFNTAIKMAAEEFDYQSLIKFLSSSKIVEKQIAVLKLQEIKSKKDAALLVSNLINQDGKVREVVAFRINELIKNPMFKKHFLNRTNYEIFTQAIMDINSNVSRLIVEVACELKQDKDFSDYFCDLLLKSINDLFEEMKKIDPRDKRYVINKKNFQLYWCLEVMDEFVEQLDFEKVKNILLQTGVFDDYTIREKTAKIIIKSPFENDIEINELKEKLKNDENYYVRRYLTE